VTVVDTTPPMVTAPPALTVAATQRDGARGNIASSAASNILSAFLAAGTAADIHDPAPARRAPQIVVDGHNVDATADTLFPVGFVTQVTFRFADSSGNIATALSSLTVSEPVGGFVEAADQVVAATDSHNGPQAVTASFAQVSQPGLLVADQLVERPPLPLGYAFAGGVFDVSTTALVAAPIELCIQGEFPAEAQLLQYENGVWTNRPGSVSAPGICATVTSLSTFAVATTANRSPTADAGAPQTAEATSAAGASVTLAGTGTDPDAGDALSFRWTEGPNELGKPNVTSSGRLRATDPDGDSLTFRILTRRQRERSSSIRRPGSSPIRRIAGPRDAISSRSVSPTVRWKPNIAEVTMSIKEK